MSQEQRLAGGKMREMRKMCMRTRTFDKDGKETKRNEKDGHERNLEK